MKYILFTLPEKNNSGKAGIHILLMTKIYYYTVYVIYRNFYPLFGAGIYHYPDASDQNLTSNPYIPDRFHFEKKRNFLLRKNSNQIKYLTQKDEYYLKYNTQNSKETLIRRMRSCNNHH